ncbi:MAG: PKD domain-containing protein, partial [Saprospiraceae bacterium]
PGGEAVLEGGLDGTLGKYGGTDDADNSGILKYVRIEFAGIAFQPNNEINSLTMGGVGSGTTIEHVQTSYGGDDAYEWFGGTVNSKFIIAYRTVDDMFDTDFGYSGKNQFVLGISDPNIADVSGSNGFESDNDAQGSNNNPLTNATFVNVSLFGPLQTPGTIIDANFKRSMHIRRNSQQDIINSVFTGFPLGIRLESSGSETGFLTGGTLRLRNNVFAGMTKFIDSTSINSPAVGVKLLADGNSQINAITDLKIANPFDATHPDFRLEAGSQLLSGNWDEIYADQFFTQVTFRGAFDGQDNWTKCWAEFDPNAANYDLAPINYFADAPVEFLYTTQAGGNVSFTGPQGNGLTYAWDFGDGNTSTEANPVHKYADNKTYQVNLVVTNERGCARDLTLVVSVSTGTKAPISFAGVALAPNPANMSTTLSFEAIAPQNMSLRLLNLDGKTIHQSNILTTAGMNQIELNTAQLSTGLYLVQLQSEDGVKTIKLEVIR